MTDAPTWLAKAVSGGQPAWSFGPSNQADVLTAVSQREGVVALADSRLTRLPGEQGTQFLDVPLPVRQTLKQAARDAVIFSMMVDAETHRLLSVMEQAAIPGLLLKGQAIARTGLPRPRPSRQRRHRCAGRNARRGGRAGSPTLRFRPRTLSALRREGLFRR